PRFLQLYKAAEPTRVETTITHYRPIVRFHIGECADTLQDIFFSTPAKFNQSAERHSFHLPQLVEIFCLRVGIPLTGTYQMHLKTNGINGKSIHALVNKCRDVCPVPFNFISLKLLI